MMWLAYLALMLFDLALIWALAYILAPATYLLRAKLRNFKQRGRPQSFVGGFPVEDDYPPRPFN